MTTGRDAVRRALAGAAAVAIGLALAVGATSAPALADAPVDFGSSDIVDTAGVLGADTAAVQSAIDKLQADTGQALLVAYVNTFENPSDREAWVQEVRESNQLGASNIVLAVAVDDRLYQLSFSDESPLQADSEQIAEEFILPSLAQDDWAGAAIGATDGIRAASNGELSGGGTGAGTGDNGAGQSDSGGGTVLLWGFLAVGVIALAIVLVTIIRRRRRAAFAKAKARQDRAALEQRAGSLLVQLDDALKTSEQEVGFAAAEFGDEAVKPFTDALASANASARQAFAVKQKLDDAFPEGDAERAAMTAEITSLAEQAIAALDARSDEFDALRALDDNAVAVLKTVTTDAEKLNDRLAAAEAHIAELHTRFEGETMSTLSGNAAQARQLLAFATETAGAAAATLSAPPTEAGHRPSVAVPVRAAQQSIGQAGQLLDAVDGVAQSLEDATAAVAKEIADVESDIAEARQTAVTERLGDAALAAPIAAAEQVLATARQSSGGRSDPLALVRRLQGVEAELDAALAPSREEKVQRERAVALLGRAQATAQAQIQAASDYIATRRGAVGSDARQRISEAQRLFELVAGDGPRRPRAGSRSGPAGPRAGGQRHPDRQERRLGLPRRRSVGRRRPRRSLDRRRRPHRSHHRRHPRRSPHRRWGWGRQLRKHLRRRWRRRRVRRRRFRRRVRRWGRLRRRRIRRQVLAEASGSRGTAHRHIRQRRTSVNQQYERGNTMAKQSIIGRITQLAKANINALLDQAEDPQKMLDQMVRDYTASIGEAESAVAQTIGNLRMLEEDHREDVTAAEDWGRKALAASRKADELRGAGNATRCRQVRRSRPRGARPPAAVRERGEGGRADDRLADRGRRPAEGRPRARCARSSTSSRPSATSSSPDRRRSRRSRR